MDTATLALVLLLLAVGCSPASAPQQPDPAPLAVPPETATPATSADGGGTLRWGIREPHSIVPATVADAHGLHVVNALFDSLAAYDAELRVVPAAAKWWSHDAAHRVWTFTLREDATFHDGSAVTAQDFAFAWQLAVRSGNVHLSDVEGYADVRDGTADRLAGVEAVDDGTLVVRLTTPRVDFASVVAHPSLAPVPRAAWEADPGAFAQQPIGNGPYRMAEQWVHGRFVRLVQFEPWRDEFHAGAKSPDEVLFRIADIDTAYVAFQQERLDITDIPDGAFDQAVATYGRSPDGYRGPGVLHGPTASVYFLGFNVASPPFDELAVRRAVSLAIDRERLADTVLEGTVEPARAATPPGLPGEHVLTCRSCVHSPTAARRIFADHGITELELWLNDDGGHAAVAQAIATDLAAAGVELELRAVPFPEYLEALQAGWPGLFRFGWTAESPEVASFLEALFHSESVPEGPGMGGNYMRYEDERVDAALDEARSIEPDTYRRELLRRAERIAVGDEQAIAPLFSYRHRTVVADRVEGFSLNALGFANLEDVSFSPTP